jgi:16S rRNA (guanine527-N7)-methyltransferase
MSEDLGSGERLQQLLANAGLSGLPPEQLSGFVRYLALIQHWNAHINLTAVRDEEGILSRHFVECIGCARALPAGIVTLLDFGSGAGFPGIPIALCRPEIQVTLAESQGKKAAFLSEAVRMLELSSRVYAGRAESLGGIFDAVILRAVDKMAEAVGVAASLVKAGGWLCLMTTEEDLSHLQNEAGPGFTWHNSAHLPGSDRRLVAFGAMER